MDVCYVSGSLGTLEVKHDSDTILEVHWVKKIKKNTGSAAQQKKIKSAFRAYWQGNFKALDRLSLGLSNQTTFQRKVLKKLRQIPAGKSISYGDLARRAGYPGAARAVGSTMASNPIALVLPCHRVVRGNGTLGNYSGTGGAVLKRKLLQFEGALE